MGHGDHASIVVITAASCARLLWMISASIKYVLRYNFNSYWNTTEIILKNRCSHILSNLVRFMSTSTSRVANELLSSTIVSANLFQLPPRTPKSWCYTKQEYWPHYYWSFVLHRTNVPTWCDIIFQRMFRMVITWLMKCKKITSFTHTHSTSTSINVINRFWLEPRQVHRWTDNVCNNCNA